MTPGRLLAIAIGVVVAASVAIGLAVIESPSKARSRRLDERRAGDLAQLARDVDLFHRRRGALPASLEELEFEPGLALQRRDPETGASYEYRALAADRFELCAVFARASDVPSSDSRRQFWTHGAGRQCFVERPRKSPGTPGPLPPRS
jgi:hypothetical protein